MRQTFEGVFSAQIAFPHLTVLFGDKRPMQETDHEGCMIRAQQSPRRVVIAQPLQAVEVNARRWV